MNPKRILLYLRARYREALAHDLIRRARFIAIVLRATWAKSKLPPKK
jgi:hypothetical protein